MPVALSINHPRAAVLINRRQLRHRTEQLLRECDVGGYTVSLHLVADAEIQELNRRYRHKDQPTNVLSFPFADGSDPALAGLPVAELGDIVISLDTAGREAKEFGQTFGYRLLWLVTHGLLHLLGYDHERSAEEEQRMQGREQQLLARITNHRRSPMPSLAVNVDHVATIRQARGTIEPDPVAAAAICELAGASGIVVHLREDRRHIQDRDVLLLRQTIKTRLNLEMGANKEIIDLALKLRPDLVTLVPEKRQELTTEGGLNVVAQKRRLAQIIKSMASRDIPVSIFIDPDPAQITGCQRHRRDLRRDPHRQVLRCRHRTRPRPGIPTRGRRRRGGLPQRPARQRRARASLPQYRPDRGAGRDRRTVHRPCHHLPGDVHRPGPGGAGDAGHHPRGPVLIARPRRQTGRAPRRSPVILLNCSMIPTVSAHLPAILAIDTAASDVVRTHIPPGWWNW